MALATTVMMLQEEQALAAALSAANTIPSSSSSMMPSLTGSNTRTTNSGTTTTMTRPVRSHSTNTLSCPSTSLAMLTRSPEDLIVEEPQPEDILCGKDKRCMTHPGSLFFKTVIDAYSTKYRSASSRQEKMEVTKKIYDMLQTSSRRFLKLNETTGKWEVLHPLAVRDKIGHSLRFQNRKSKSLSSNSLNKSASMGMINSMNKPRRMESNTSLASSCASSVNSGLDLSNWSSSNQRGGNLSPRPSGGGMANATWTSRNTPNKLKNKLLLNRLGLVGSTSSNNNLLAGDMTSNSNNNNKLPFEVSFLSLNLDSNQGQGNGIGIGIGIGQQEQPSPLSQLGVAGSMTLPSLHLSPTRLRPQTSIGTTSSNTTSSSIATTNSMASRTNIHNSIINPLATAMEEEDDLDDDFLLEPTPIRSLQDNHPATLQQQQQEQQQQQGHEDQDEQEDLSWIMQLPIMEESPVDNKIYFVE